MTISGQTYFSELTFPVPPVLPVTPDVGLTGQRFWGRLDDVTVSTATPPRFFSLDNRFSAGVDEFLQGTTLQQPEQVSLTVPSSPPDREAMDSGPPNYERLVGANSRNYMGVTGTTNPTDYHGFLVFRQDLTPTLSSSSVWQNHMVFGDAPSLFTGAFVSDFSGPHISWYHWDGSQKRNDHPIVVGQVHLLEFWHTGTDIFSRLDDGAPLSTAANGQSGNGAITLGADATRPNDVRVFELIFCRPNNSANSQLPNVRAYFNDRYGVTV